ncbi:hypothetical protein ACER0C_019936 [Sarotherodon galilaeus]
MEHAYFASGKAWHRGQQLRYTRLPQGFALSPGIFNQVLKQTLEPCVMPAGCTLVQYVDDLLIAAPTADACFQATMTVLRRLAEAGFKVSKDKLQLVRPQVTFLGREVKQHMVGMMAAHRSAILSHPRPETVKEMLSFLGLTGYSRQYIPDYVGRTRPLRDLVKQHGMRDLTAKLNWTTEAEQCFISLKQDLSRAVDLAVPDYNRDFFLDVSETKGVVNGVLFQKKGGGRQVLMYISVCLDNMEKRHPTCTQHVAGVAKAIQKVAHIVRGHPLRVLTTHSVVAYVNSQAFTMTPLRQQRLSKVLEAPYLTFTHEGINMADQMGSGEPHNCAQAVWKEEKTRPDLKAEAMEGAEDLFTDGCCFRDEKEGLKAGYAVVSKRGEQLEVIKAAKLEGQQSAQRAEVIALIEALKYAQGKKINIYTDSAYAFGAAHVELGQWKRAGFLTTNQQPIKHEKEMRALEEALEGPLEVAIIKCKGHDNSATWVARGNRAADEAAKKVVGYTGIRQMVSTGIDWEENPGLEREEIIKEQEKASPEEESLWKERGAIKVSNIWRGPDGRPVLTADLAERKVREAHGLGHVGVAQMERNLCHWWHPFLKDMLREHVRTCLICGQHNPKPTVKPEMGKFPLVQRPGQEIVIDYTDMVTPARGFRYLLVTAGQGQEQTVPEAKWVWLKVYKRKWNEPRWTGPFEVGTRTSHAVQLKGKGETWYHWSQCAVAEEPKRSERLLAKEKRGNSAETPHMDPSPGTE